VPGKRWSPDHRTPGVHNLSFGLVLGYCCRGGVAVALRARTVAVEQEDLSSLISDKAHALWYSIDVQ
jgi:hypothetical protein